MRVEYTKYRPCQVRVAGRPVRPDRERVQAGGLVIVKVRVRVRVRVSR